MNYYFIYEDFIYGFKDKGLISYCKFQKFGAKELMLPVHEKTKLPCLAL